MYDFDFGFLLKHLSFLLGGLVATVVLSITAMGPGLLLGLAIALARSSRSPLIRGPAALYVALFVSTPLLVQLVWIFFVLPIFLGYTISASLAAFLSLSLYIAAYLSEILRAGIRSIDRGQKEAARALGMSDVQAMRRIILPQATVLMLPPIANTYVSLFKETSIVSAIGVADLLRQGLALSQISFRPVEALTFVAVVYAVLAYIQTAWVNRLHARLLAH